MRVPALSCAVLMLLARPLFGGLSDSDLPTCAATYFAFVDAAGNARMRTPEGVLRPFTRVGGDAKRLVLKSPDGWTAVRSGDEVEVRSPDAGDPLVFRYSGGVMKSLLRKGRTHRYRYRHSVVYDGEDAHDLWPKKAEVDPESVVRDNKMWKGGSRMKLWFTSPNQCGAFLAFFLMVAAGLFFSAKTRVWRLHTCLWMLILSLLLVQTGSRGALLAAVLGASSIIVCALHQRGKLRLKTLFVSGCAVLLVGVAAFGCFYLKTRTRAGDQKSDAFRKELFTVAPKMVHDAPWGWGHWIDVGRAYSLWYQPTGGIIQLRMNLVSDHVTQIAASGYVKGGLYVFAWLAGLTLLFAYAWKGGSAIPVAVWLVLAVASSLNVVLKAPGIIWIPLATLLLPISRRSPLRRIRWWLPPGVGLVGAVLAMGTFWLVGERVPDRIPSIRYSGGRLCLNGDNPATWLLDDRETLGGIASVMQIRAFYAQKPTASALGYVCELEKLPPVRMQRLVVVGTQCENLLAAFEKGTFHSQARDIVLLSPPFAPSRFRAFAPPESRVHFVYGEFLARYFGELDPSAPDVQIVPGSERYLCNWLSYCVN